MNCTEHHTVCVMSSLLISTSAVTFLFFPSLSISTDCTLLHFLSLCVKGVGTADLFGGKKIDKNTSVSLYKKVKFK